MIKISYHHFPLISGPLFFFLCITFFDFDPVNKHVTIMAGIAIWMAIWWIAEVIPLGITALLPVVLFPVTGIMSGKEVSPIYFNHIIFLFIGGFLVALCMQRWDLHKRIAIRILLLFGVRPKNILLGFIVATAFLSMWISNTATTMMMVPIAMAIVIRLEDMIGAEEVRKYSIGIFIGIAYSASIGGISTLVGTPPNLSFSRIYSIMFPTEPEISFTDWFLFAFPLSLIFLAILWIILTLMFRPKNGQFNLDKGLFEKQYKELGPISFEEKVVLINFITLAFLWLFRADIQFGNFVIPGWSRLFPYPEYINDGTVAIAIALILFIIPTKKRGSKTILNWETAAKLPWNIVLLFGGGFALASGFRESGLAMWLGEKFTGVGDLNPVFVITAICFFVTFLTELTSNTATAEMLLPILGSLAVAIQINPLLLMIPATLSCSCAFMLPVATPPNAIIFGTGRLKVPEMVKIGIFMNLIGIVLITLTVFTLGKFVFGF